MALEEIQDAVRAGEYARAASLFTEYAGALPLDEGSLREMAELLEWTRTTVLCARAQLQAHVQTLRDEAHLVAAYGS
ncbi:MAG: hypothetical protein K0S78_3659 [Thermomicrobiales bacterium]|jgi:hypothetical protein|nr:hypothetical protein [Thermomicrobiales bacterium]